MIYRLFSTMYLILPALVANLVPVFAKKLPYNYPLDFGLRYRGKQLLGQNKTVGGFFLGLIASTLTAYVQASVYPVTVSQGWFVFGVALGCGALLGDAVKSFFKRRRGIKPGKSWVPFDQVDYGVGTVVVLGFFVPLSVVDVVIIIVGCGVMHVMTTSTGYFLGLREQPW